MTQQPRGGIASPQLQRSSIAATEDLREAAREALGPRFREFTGQLSAALTSMVTKVAVPADQRMYQTLAKFALSAAEQWTESFVQNVDAHLVGEAWSEQRDANANTDNNDDSVMIANVELRAESRYRKQVMELDARVNRLRLMIQMPVFTKALAPAGLCRSLQDTADALDWPVKHRGLLLEQFDKAFISNLESLYASLIETLIKITASVEKTLAESGITKSPPPKRPKKWAHTMAPPEDQKNVDPETIAMLQTFALKTDGAGYTNGLLAADLLALADDRPLTGVTKDQTWVPLQRISLAGHFLNEAIADPMLPEEANKQHETVRYPLLKSALTDQTVFTTATHPLGMMVNELLLKAATSRVTGNVETRRSADLLHELMVQFDLSPEFVRQSMDIANPIHKTQVERFFELQRQQAQERRNFVILEAKRAVADQLERHTLGRYAPAPAIKFLNAAWGPLLTKRLLQHGAAHPLSKAGTALMEQLLDQLEARQPDQPASTEWKEVTMTMGKSLLAEGMSVENVKTALTSLEQARTTPLSQ